MRDVCLIERWPGKSADEHGIEHPAIYHMLDVAAVAEVLLAPFDMPPERKSALALLTALHDIGKISESFRNMLRCGQPQTYRHWELSEVYLLHAHQVLSDALKPGRPKRLLPLYAATAGHHGRPPKLTPDQKSRAALGISADVLADMQDVVVAFLDLWPDGSVSGLSAAAVNELSWWLSGLVNAADWIGSNTQWFPATAASLPLDAYLARARSIARRAVQEAGLGAPNLSDASLFDWPSLRPMQQACLDIALPDGPCLALIEDETGAGKTEAALMLAQRMLRSGQGRGLFFALPTMATADAMFSRVSKTIGRAFETPPTVTLAHGRAELRDIVQGRANAPEDVSCTEWLDDSRRRALLANVGIGTVDQALLSVLPVKFQALRHFGLSSKILIVDEVHEMGEPYIAQTLCTLLRMHRNAGGSVILLTATLPLELRRDLLATYGGGDDGDFAYPALTIAGGASNRNLPQDTSAKGPVAVERLDGPAAAVELIAAQAEQGAACVWIRNAVDDAIAAVEALRARGIAADLLHARFALGDRKAIEAAARQRFGRMAAGRVGRVLVGTQILESSLDLDFDVMVSDLAPMAGLIQRAGRLWRHMDLRPRAGRPVPRPVLHVVSPDPAVVDAENWLHKCMDKGAFVYPADIMWRTAVHLFAAGEIIAPSGIRDLIEASYSEQPALPTVLEAAELNRLGQEMSHSSLASQNVVDLGKDYRSGGQAHDDATYPTRLGEEQVALVLAKISGENLVPFIDGSDGWAMSELSVARRKLDRFEMPDQAAAAIQNITADWPDWKRQRYLVLPVAEDGSICDGLRYSSVYGLLYEPDSRV